MRFGFVLTKEQGESGLSGWARTIRVQETAGAEAELSEQLRPWALETVRRERGANGRCLAYLVELDENGDYDTYLAHTVEDLIWYYEQEYVPA